MSQRKPLTIQVEPFAAIWPEVNALAREHFHEVEGELADRRPFRLNADAMQRMCAAGILKIVTARRGNKLEGYCTWQLSHDLESEGLLIAQQGAWFTLPSGSGAGVRMFKRAVEELRACGVKAMFPHYRLRGRGARLGNWFERQGAVPIQVTHFLWIGDGANA